MYLMAASSTAASSTAASREGTSTKASREATRIKDTKERVLKDSVSKENEVGNEVRYIYSRNVIFLYKSILNKIFLVKKMFGVLSIFGSF